MLSKYKVFVIVEDLSSNDNYYLSIENYVPSILAGTNIYVIETFRKYILKNEIVKKMIGKKLGIEKFNIYIDTITNKDSKINLGNFFTIKYNFTKFNKLYVKLFDMEKSDYFILKNKIEYPKYPYCFLIKN